MNSVLYLQHQITRDGTSNEKSIGAYTSLANAGRAISRLKSRPGFRDFRGRFVVYEVRINKDYLPAGFDQPANEISTLEVSALDGSLDIQAGGLYRVYNQCTSGDEQSDNDYVLIGFYESEKMAQSAIERLRGYANFGDPDREFGLDLYKLDADNWSEGFGVDDE